MATKTASELKSQLKKEGYRLPHGYDIVKRKPLAKRSNLRYLGLTISKGAGVNGKTFYWLDKKVSSTPKKTITDAKKSIISHLIQGKVSVLKIAEIKSKHSQIKTIADLNKIISDKKAPAVKKKATSAKQTLAQRKFASNARRAAAMVKNGKAKDTKAAWKQLKMEF